MVEKATLWETLLNSLIFGVLLVFHAIIAVVAVLAVDVVALWLFNLLTDVNTWLTLLFVEGAIMMALSVASYSTGSGPAFSPWPNAPLPRRFRVKYRYPRLWVTLGIAGLVLIILSAYLGLHYY